QAATASADQRRIDGSPAHVGDQRLLVDRNVDPLAVPRGKARERFPRLEPAGHLAHDPGPIAGLPQRGRSPATLATGQLQALAVAERAVWLDAAAVVLGILLRVVAVDEGDGQALVLTELDAVEVARL